MTPEQRKHRGDIAQATLNHDFIKQCIEDMRQGCLVNLEGTAHDRPEDRENIYYLLKAVSAFEGILFSYIQDGKMALNELNQHNIKQIKR